MEADRWRDWMTFFITLDLTWVISLPSALLKSPVKFSCTQTPWGSAPNPLGISLVKVVLYDRCKDVTLAFPQTAQGGNVPSHLQCPDSTEFSPYHSRYEILYLPNRRAYLGSLVRRLHRPYLGTFKTWLRLLFIQPGEPNLDSACLTPSFYTVHTQTRFS